MKYDTLLGRPKARAAKPSATKPLPELVSVDVVTSGCMLIGNVEERLERFDNGWVITFVAEWNDAGSRAFCWKVYPAKQNESLAIEALRRKAKDYGIDRIGILCIDRPVSSAKADDEK